MKKTNSVFEARENQEGTFLNYKKFSSPRRRTRARREFKLFGVEQKS